MRPETEKAAPNRDARQSTPDRGDQDAREITTGARLYAVRDSGGRLGLASLPGTRDFHRRAGR